MSPMKSDLAALTRRIVEQMDPRLRVSGVLAIEGRNGCAELLVAVEGCHADVCFLALNVDRTGRSVVERDLVAQLRLVIDAHLETR